MRIPDQTDCEACDGEGHISTAGDCTVLRSECCGGCDRPCTECKDGQVNVECEECGHHELFDGVCEWCEEHKESEAVA